MSLMMKTFTLVASHVVETGLAGKRVLVTGASGGIGSACARAFMEEGCEVVAHYHRGRGRAEALGAAAVLGADLTVEAEAERLFDEAGPLDVCAAVAGVWPSEDVPVWERALLAGAGRLDGRLFGEAGHADYAAAKSAIVGGLLLSLKNEVVRVAPRARVNAVCPGWTHSPMTRAELDDPELVRRVTRTMPLRKVARAEDVAAQVVALASDEISGHVTGQVVTVAGGMEGRVLHSDQPD